jgi:hypothetical protein
MGLLKSMIRSARGSGFAILLLLGAFSLATTPACAGNPNYETIQATFAQAGNSVSVTLIVYNYSSPADLQILSQAFQEGQDRGLAIALSKTKAVGQCSITGTIGYEVAFIQMVPSPTGRTITFITSRPQPLDEADPLASSQTFDLAVGQFELNDTNPAKSKGFLFPASKLAIDRQGEFHYDLTLRPWTLIDVLDSPGTPVQAGPSVPGSNTTAQSGNLLPMEVHSGSPLPVASSAMAKTCRCSPWGRAGLAMLLLVMPSRISL